LDFLNIAFNTKRNLIVKLILILKLFQLCLNDYILNPILKLLPQVEYIFFKFKDSQLEFGKILNLVKDQDQKLELTNTNFHATLNHFIMLVVVQGILTHGDDSI
jgi:hypothetical protein